MIAKTSEQISMHSSSFKLILQIFQLGQCGMEAWILKAAWMINAWLLSDSKMSVGGNPGRLPLFSEEYQAHVIDSSDMGFLSSLNTKAECPSNPSLLLRLQLFSPPALEGKRHTTMLARTPLISKTPASVFALLLPKLTRHHSNGRMSAKAFSAVLSFSDAMSRLYYSRCWIFR
jgi:hypothetical protein